MSAFLNKGRLISLSLWILAICFGLHLLYAFALTPVFGDDAFNHLAWLEDFTRLRALDQDYPRWIPYTFGAMGAPTFYFYPPLCYLIADVYFSLGIATSTHGLFHAVNASTLALSAITCFIYLRNRGLHDRSALIGCLLYSIASYRYVDVYTRAALGEHAAFAWIPLVLLSVDLAVASSTTLQRLKALVIAAFGWGLLMLTNLPSTSLIAIITVPYGLLLYGKSIVRIWPAAFGAVLGLLMCSASILPLLFFKPFIQTENLWNLDIYSSKWHHFLVEIFEPETRKSAIQISAIVSAFLAMAALYLVKGKELISRSYKWALASIALVSLFFQLPFISDPFYNSFPPLQLLQFSWRFTMGLVLFTAIAIAIAIDRRISRAEYLLLGTSLVSLYFYLRFGYIMLTFPTAPYMVEPYRRGAPEYINEYVRLDKDSVRNWAIAKMAEPTFSADRAIAVSNEYQNADTLKATIHAEANTDLFIKRLWWPQWKFEYKLQSENSKYVSAAIEPTDEGLIVVRNLPAAPIQIRLTIEESASEKNGKRLSILGVLIFASLCITGFFLESRPSKKNEV